MTRRPFRADAPISCLDSTFMAYSVFEPFFFTRYARPTALHGPKEPNTGQHKLEGQSQ